ncbi:MAG: cytochrome c [Gammaproteobacteria bacterium]|nr:cytochrome c [Gammaproteobacteria bacterium]
MKKLFLFLTLSISLNNLSHAAASHPGKVLHDAKCLSCHGSEVYTRKDRMAHSLYALDKQIRNCMKGPANADWNDKETAQVIDYLNQQFYHYKASN